MVSTGTVFEKRKDQDAFIIQSNAQFNPQTMPIPQNLRQPQPMMMPQNDISPMLNTSSPVAATHGALTLDKPQLSVTSAITMVRGKKIKKVKIKRKIHSHKNK